MFAASATRVGFSTVLRAAVATALLAISLAGCGSAARAPASPDQATLHRIDGLLSALTRLQGQINVAPRVRQRAAYVQSNGPAIDAFDQRSQQLGRAIAALHAPEAAQIYAPLATAIATQATDMKQYVSSVTVGDRGSIARLSARVDRDELHVNRVAVEQFPKARAYAVKLNRSG